MYFKVLKQVLQSSLQKGLQSSLHTFFNVYLINDWLQSQKYMSIIYSSSDTKNYFLKN